MPYLYWPMKADLMAATLLVCCPVMARMAAEDPLEAPIASRASAVVPPGIPAVPAPSLEPDPPLPSPGLSLVPNIVNCFPLPPLHREFLNHEDPMANSINSLGTA